MQKKRQILKHDDPTFWPVTIILNLHIIMYMNNAILNEETALRLNYNSLYFQSNAFILISYINPTLSRENLRTNSIQ